MVAGILEGCKHSLSQQAAAPKAVFLQKFIEDMRAIRSAAVQTSQLDKPGFVFDLLAFCLSPASGYYNSTLALPFIHEKNAPSIDDASDLRLTGALLAEINDDWQCRKYLDMVELHAWSRERNADEKEETVIVI